MATEETPRFRIPYPGADDQGTWFAKFQNGMNQIDSHMFALLENQKVMMKQLPDCVVTGPDGGGLYWFQTATETILVSRTLLVDLVVSTTALEVKPGRLIGLTLTSGAVGTQYLDWELFENGTDIDGAVQVLGYVNADWSITWFNASHLPVGVTMQLFEVGTSGGMPTGWGQIHVDSVNGSNVSGDGSPEYPYKTLAFAMSPAIVPLPVDWAAFNTGVQYVLAPGTYDAGAPTVVLPQRRFITITGSRYEITCNLEWLFEYQYWFNGGGAHPPATNWQTVTFSTDTPLESKLTGDFWRQNGANDLNASDNAMLLLYGLSLGGDIINAESGNVGANKQTGRCVLGFFNCKTTPFVTGKFIGGQRETDLANMSKKTNAWRLMMNDAYLYGHSIVGCNDILGIRNCLFEGDYFTWSRDTAGGAGYAGRLCGDTASVGLGITDSIFRLGVGVPEFGMDLAEASFADPVRVSMDAATAQKLADEAATWTKFNTDAYGYILKDTIEWQREWPRDSTVLVERGPTDLVSMVNLQAAYDKACALTPGGAALATDNRAYVIVPGGKYELAPGAMFEFNTPYVDLVALSGYGTEQSTPVGTVKIYSAAPAVTGVCQTHVEDFRLAGIHISTIGAVPALRVDNGCDASLAVVKGCKFTNDGTVACVDHALGDAAPVIGGIWENCKGGPGFMSECTVNAKLRQCVGGTGSFGSGTVSGDFAGVATDCTAGKNSFGFCSGDGVSVTGTFVRCIAGDSSFGCGIENVIVSATFIDCAAGDHSFGYSQTITNPATVLFSGVAQRCLAGDYSFGYVDDTALIGGCAATFSGSMIEVYAGLDSFGSAIPVATATGTFSGVARTCFSNGDSFGSHASSGVMKDCQNLHRTCALPANANCKMYNATLSVVMGSVNWAITGEIDGSGAIPVPPFGEFYVVTVAGGGYLVGEIWEGIAGPAWQKVVVPAFKIMQPVADYGLGPLYLADKFYVSDGLDGWARIYLNSCVIVKQDTPVFYNCTFVSDDGVTPTITSQFGLKNIKAVQCRLNTNIDVGITNVIPMGGNVVNSAVEV